MSLDMQSIILRSEIRLCPKNVPIFLIYQRLEGVEALEGHEKVPTEHIELFMKIT
jgi:hypothetical protein